MLLYYEKIEKKFKKTGDAKFKKNVMLSVFLISTF